MDAGDRTRSWVLRARSGRGMRLGLSRCAAGEQQGGVRSPRSWGRDCGVLVDIIVVDATRRLGDFGVCGCLHVVTCVRVYGK